MGHAAVLGAVQQGPGCGQQGFEHTYGILGEMFLQLRTSNRVGVDPRSKPWGSANVPSQGCHSWPPQGQQPTAGCSPQHLPQEHGGTELRPLKLSPHGWLSRAELKPPGASQEEGQRAFCLSEHAKGFLSVPNCGCKPASPCPSGPPAHPRQRSPRPGPLRWERLEAPPAAPGKATTRSAPVWAADRIAQPLASPPAAPRPRQPRPRHLESPLCRAPPCASPHQGTERGLQLQTPQRGRPCRELGCSRALDPEVLQSPSGVQ